jgi:hypothetical protein
MFSRLKVTFFILSAGLLVLAGAACENKYGVAGISDNDVVATVGDAQITFGDWMRQLDLLRVFSPQPVDPNNADQVKEVLQSLEDQEVVLSALRKANYSDPKFDEDVQKQLVQSDLQIKQIKDKLKKDQETVNRLEKNYKDAYTKMLLAQHFAATQVDSVSVSNQEIKERYELFSIEAKKAGQDVPPFDKVKDQIKIRIQADKLLAQFQGDLKISQKDDVIAKYLATLSPSEQALNDNKILPPQGSN